MISVPHEVMTNFVTLLRVRGVPERHKEYYQKWLRYFYDFSGKYLSEQDQMVQVKLFLDKLKSKGQSTAQCQQAAHAVALYFELLEQNKIAVNNTDDQAPAEFEKGRFKAGPASEPMAPTPRSELFGCLRASRYSEAGYEEKSDSPEWDEVIGKLAAEIKVRHYSRKTLKTYALWSRQFQRFLKNKPPEDLGTADVKEYLTHLAVTCHVAASTQNQAFNSLLFLYRHALKRDFGELCDVPRAKKSLYIPVVLSREEIDSILTHLYHPYKLIVKLLFGCGLRLFECLQLRVRDFNFDAKILTIHGKGKKDRTVPLPESIIEELHRQLKRVRTLHERDMAEEYDGVFLDDAVEKKFPKAPRELLHQWFFPQKELTLVEASEQRRRAHVHESRLQKALYVAVRRASITKRVTAHTFRHSFATHLLQANYDIRTIQKLLGHSSLKTTMIYTHCVPVRTIQEPKSPLDLAPD
ncbi:integron integrase [Geotalea sp. SG265]|uniref:integron integrase n=1 Tax=Geotalea sp. SG265 TaxID=2922867 RepID=UPI001FAEC0A8|nr:integron integrase [Geotalea sp. SG265]